MPVHKHGPNHRQATPLDPPSSVGGEWNSRKWHHWEKFVSKNAKVSRKHILTDGSGKAYGFFFGGRGEGLDPELEKIVTKFSKTAAWSAGGGGKDVRLLSKFSLLGSTFLKKCYFCISKYVLLSSHA